MKPRFFFIVIVSLVCSAQISFSDEAPKSQILRQALTAATKFLKRHPDRAQILFPTGYALPEVSDEILLSIRLKDFSTKLIRLNTFKNTLLDFGLSLTAAQSRKNILETYKLIYNNLPAEIRKKALPYKQVKALSINELLVRQKSLLSLVHKYFDRILQLRPSATMISLPFLNNPIADCALEVGGEYAGVDSEVSDRCFANEYNSNGLMANTSFPLKDNLTCIKDQGARGTCGSHAVAATIESLRLVRNSVAENLSEQHINYTAETRSDSQISLVDMQTSGVCTGCALQEYFNRSLPFYYERDWNYNRALSIDPIAVDPSTSTLIYPNSCSAQYGGEQCSNYSWQTAATVSLPGVPLPQSAPGGARTIERINSFSYLLSDGVAGPVSRTALETAIILVANDVPVILSITSTDALGASSDGYVIYSASDTARGGHAMEIVGFVPNSQLPASAPQATERGFFIVKNSWGKAAGDCGFYYLDYGYVLHFFNYIAIVDIR